MPSATSTVVDFADETAEGDKPAVAVPAAPRKLTRIRRDAPAAPGTGSASEGDASAK